MSLSLFKWRFSLRNHSGGLENFIQSSLLYNLPHLCQEDWYTEGQAEKWEKYVLMACQKHYLMWTCYSFKAATFFIATSFLGVAKSLHAFFVYTKLWVKRKNPLDYLSLFLSFSVKFSQTCQGITKHRAVFFHWLLLSPRPWHAVNSNPYCQEQQQLCSFSFLIFKVTQTCNIIYTSWMWGTTGLSYS